MGSKWSLYEIEWLKENYALLSGKDLAAFLSRSVPSIQQKAFRLGIKLPDVEKIKRQIENGLQAFERINGGYGGDNLNKRGVRKSNSEYKHIQNERFPGRNTTRDITRYAIKKGIITKTPCEICGAIEVEAHHSDYTKPLEVIFLCRKHHREWHKKQEDR